MKPAILSVTLMLVASSSASAALITIDHNELTISGEIEPGDDLKFEQLSAQMKDDVSVVLDGPGGAFIPAITIAEIIKARHWRTKVNANSSCVSSCAFIWLAGSPRIATRTSRIGFHRVYHFKENMKSVEDSGPGNAYLGKYLDSLGFDYATVEFIVRANPWQMNYLTAEIASKYKINFEGSLPGSPSPVSLPSKQADGFRLLDQTSIINQNILPKNLKLPISSGWRRYTTECALYGRYCN
jgi:hypothetical protein